MNYVPDVDEMLIPAPFRLGTNEPHYRTQGHSFVIPADPEVLQRLLNEHLNVPLGAKENDPNDPWDITWGQANHRTCDGVSGPEKIKFVVLQNLYGIVLNVLRYWRVDAQAQPELGYIAYTETLLQFLVHRVLEGAEDAPNESFYFLAAVYIDDSAFRGELQDPHSLPILLGREAYGLPKNPGQIYYCPDDANNPTGPRLNIWDYNPETIEKLTLQAAITVNPDTWATPDHDYCPAEPEPLREGTTYGPLAAQLGVEERDLRMGPLDDPDDPFRDAARVVDLSRERRIVIRNDLHLFAKLVGLKQFPDPTSSLTPAGTIEACYQHVVESAVEHLADEEPVPYAVTSDHVIEFHDRSRVDLANELGITLDANRRISVPDVNCHYMVSNFVYGRPCRTDVWEPV